MHLRNYKFIHCEMITIKSNLSDSNDSFISIFHKYITQNTKWKANSIAPTMWRPFLLHFLFILNIHYEKERVNICENVKYAFTVFLIKIWTEYTNNIYLHIYLLSYACMYWKELFRELLLIGKKLSFYLFEVLYFLAERKYRKIFIN